MRSRTLIAITALAALIAAACGGSDSDATPTSASDDPTTAPQTTSTDTSASQAVATIDGAGPWDWNIVRVDQGTKPGIALAQDGTPLIAYMLERAGNAGFVNVATGTANGFTTETLQRGYMYGPLDIATGPEGAVVTYHNHDWEDAAVAIQTTEGWDVSRVVSNGHDGWDGSLALASDGSIHLLGIAPSQFGAPEGIEYVTRLGDAWDVQSLGAGPQPYEWGTDLAVAADGTAHAVYFDFAARDLVYATNAGGTWTRTPIYEDGDAARFAVIALGDDGTTHVAFIQSDSPIADDGAHRVNVIYGALTTDGWQFETVAELQQMVTGFEGARRTVALDLGPGGPVIAAIDEAQLLLARLVDGAWTSEVIVTAAADPLQIVGLALDASGSPHLTYATTTGNGPLDGEVWYLAPIIRS